MKSYYLIFIFVNFYLVNSYFTKSGRCPESVKLQDDFRLADFFDKWYQVYHYSSDERPKNNCSEVQLDSDKYGINVNLSRVDRGLFHRYSLGKLKIPKKLEDAANLTITFTDINAPRRLVTRNYAFRVLATNYKYYATIYTCQYSPLINKHFTYVWILSRNKILNDVSKELAIKPLKQLGISEKELVKDDLGKKCSPKYYDDKPVDPLAFNTPVPV